MSSLKLIALDRRTQQKCHIVSIHFDVWDDDPHKIDNVYIAMGKNIVVKRQAREVEIIKAE